MSSSGRWRRERHPRRHQPRPPPRLGRRRQPDQVEHDEASQLDRVDRRQRRLQDPLAAAHGVDELRPLAVDRQERDPVERAAVDRLAEVRRQAQGDRGRHVPRRPHVSALLLAEQPRERRQPPLAARGCTGPRGRTPPTSGRTTPASPGRPARSRAARARLVHDPAPELSRLPPALVARVRAQHEEQHEEHPLCIAPAPRRADPTRRSRGRVQSMNHKARKPWPGGSPSARPTRATRARLAKNADWRCRAGPRWRNPHGCARRNTRGRTDGLRPADRRSVGWTSYAQRLFQKDP
ncbi:hypothetical protein SAMN02745121_05966 [Nannocystis exedens]|uniref:Uncharacterized protein n=1 Tax=Nannocystis exedens TaxID=54 RepID=A0A1I2EAL5_9BACT|nr:hypothetical protein NAEX_07955 [Nannocystis exedens]SFE89723.1 hypothetical protein SAMN02745121_05966 [Nannocystis exedens]